MAQIEVLKSIAKKLGVTIKKKDGVDEIIAALRESDPTLKALLDLTLSELAELDEAGIVNPFSSSDSRTADEPEEAEEEETEDDEDDEEEEEESDEDDDDEDESDDDDEESDDEPDQAWKEKWDDDDDSDDEEEEEEEEPKKPAKGKGKVKNVPAKPAPRKKK